MLILNFLLFFVVFLGFECSPCKKREYGENKIVCVCDESYCDDLVLLSKVSSKQAAVYETNQAGARFESTLTNFSSAYISGVPVLSINRSSIYQFILGFGGAFTDAAGINIKSVTQKLQKILLNSYFSENGLKYNMGRIPIASCDFSTRSYSYDDVKDDFNLTQFKLAKEDFIYKIPYIHLAQSISQEDILLFGSPWSPPAWMKTNGASNGQGWIKGQPGGKFYKTYANYLVRFLQSYNENNITLWGLTLQNEPTDGCLEKFAFQSLCFPPDKQRDFLKLDFGPALKEAGFTPDNLKLMIVDDVRATVSRCTDVIMSDKEAAQYVSGIAFHWYYEEFNPHKLLDISHGKHPDLFFLPTEACTGSYPWEFPKADLGSWGRAERYANDIIKDLLNWSIGWIDWNLALDMQGGPNWVSNFVDAPIIVNVGTNEFYKQPMYYALAHFSKCLPRGSFRIGLNVTDDMNGAFSTFSIAAFQTPQDKIVVIALNRKDNPVPLVLHDPLKRNSIDCQPTHKTIHLKERVLIEEAHSSKMVSQLKSSLLVAFCLVYFVGEAIGFECSPCKKREYGENKIVCVCDESYCDDLVLLSNVSSDQAAVYESNLAGARFESTLKSFSSAATHIAGVPVLTVNHSSIYQFILGFGGAFTDSAGINIKSVSPKLQGILLNSYFSENGLEYNMGRIPIASCDFSTRTYSYDDVKDDFNLTYFKLVEEDFIYKIPYIHLAQSISQEEILLFGSPWSPPAWMKTNGRSNGQGRIKGEPGGEFYKTYANYLIRFLQSYSEHNLTMWGLTLQNEPTAGCLKRFPFQSLCFPPDKQRDFLKLDFGPALRAAGFTPDKLKLMIVDFFRSSISDHLDVIMSDKEAAQYVSGIAFHWYEEENIPHELLDIAHRDQPDLFLLPTEACTGSYPWEFPKVDLGSWSRAERYANDIIKDLLNWSIGWIDWNLALDMQGGPNWVSNFVDAPIIVNAGTNEFYKQPMYYALAHFSKFLPRGSFRIGLNVTDDMNGIYSNFSIAAFQTPQEKTVVIALNRKDDPVPLILQDPLKGFLDITVNPHSIQTYIW
ncbi:hypothetical protein JTE90_006978 [Oedothorax gibbosus]|uniref:Glucosylceramidase n=1 Tax=Oedothorax gibbosus TaxID=931172 RepID=A0AAV6V9N0_9ARAC|nr:hypothetical protein JTE90_006978 [Oedothorax gibbosus]